MKTLRLVLFISLSFVFGQQALAMANCLVNKHSFACQMDVLEGSSVGGIVTPLVGWPTGSAQWDASLYVSKVTIKPAVQTLVDSSNTMRTCGIDFQGARQIRISTFKNGNAMTLEMTPFLSGGKRVYQGTVANNNIINVEGNEPFLQSAKGKGVKHVASRLKCSIFTRAKLNHMSCALIDIREDGSELLIGILGSLPAGKMPAACGQAKLKSVVL